MRRPMRLPKMMKYSDAVIAGGIRVCPQMRMIRPNSRIRMVSKPVRFCWKREATGRCPGVPFTTLVATGSLPRGRRLALAFDDAHEELFEAVDLVAHAEHFDALLRQSREHVVQVLLAILLDLEGVIVRELDEVAGQRRRRAGGVAQIQDE